MFYITLAFHHSVHGQKLVRARLTLFYHLQVKHQIPVKKYVKKKFHDNFAYLLVYICYKYCSASAPCDI